MNARVLRTQLASCATGVVRMRSRSWEAGSSRGSCWTNSPLNAFTNMDWSSCVSSFTCIFSASSLRLHLQICRRVAESKRLSSTEHSESCKFCPLQTYTRRLFLLGPLQVQVSTAKPRGRKKQPETILGFFIGRTIRFKTKKSVIQKINVL